jgi:hypothetical protein
MANKRKLKLYWASTEDHHEDWFIVASTAKKAAKLHEDLEGYNPGDALVEEILPIPVDVFVEEPGWPTHELLLALGATVINTDNSRVVEIDGKTFCEGLLAATIDETVDDFFERIGQGRLNNTSKGPDVPADFRQDGSDPRSLPPSARVEYEESLLDNHTCSTCGAVRVFEADEVSANKRSPSLRKKISCPECGCQITQEVRFSAPEKQHFIDNLPLDVTANWFGDDEIDGDDLDDIFGPEAMGECQGCDSFVSLDDLGLCDLCSDKLARDMIRKRDWAYSALAYGVPREQQEELRRKVIAQYGEKLELIAPSGKSKSNRKRKKRKKRRMGH